MGPGGEYGQCWSKVFVVVGVVARRQSDHEFQSGRVERGRQRADEFAKVRLAGIGNLFKIDDDACLVRLHRVFNNVPHQSLPRNGVR